MVTHLSSCCTLVPQMILTAPPSFQINGRDLQGVHVSRGWTPSSSIWEPTTSHWTKQSTWPRTVLCAGWCLCMALCTPNGASQKKRSTTVTERAEVKVNKWTLQPSQVMAPKWNPDDGALHTLHDIDLKSTFSFLSSSQPAQNDWSKWNATE